MNSIKKIIVIAFCLAVMLALTVRIDFLSDPKSVRNIDGNRLVLENGSAIVFTELQYIPTNHVVLAALDSGVEISDDGLAYGLLRMYHYCGNDFVRYDRRRLCINALCVVTDPNCIRQEYLNDNEIKAKVELYLSRPSCSEIKAGRGWPLGNDTYVYTFERELKRVRR